MKKNKISTMAEVAAFASIAFVLDVLAGFYSGFFPSGGSISLAIIPIVILSFRRGPIAGVLCGLLVGLLDLTDGFYTISTKWYHSILQVGFDYILGYMLVGLVGLAKPLFKKYKIFSISLIFTLIAGVNKFILHFLSGVLYWPQYEGQPYGDRIIYSLIYNGSYMIPTIILCGIITSLLSIKFKDLFIVKEWFKG